MFVLKKIFRKREPFLVGLHLTGRKEVKGLDNKERLELWIEEYTQRLVRLAYTYVHDWADAEDRVQDAFIKAYHSMNKLKNTHDPFPWLARIVINECKSFFRKNWCEIITSILPERIETSTEEKYLDYINNEAIHDAVLALPNHYSTPIVLFYFEDLSLKQISEIMGINTGTVKSRLARGRQRLKKQLGEANEYGREIKKCERTL